jgi:nucleoside-diphosphate-sugar epimerase
MKAFVTGATGFIGGRLARKLRDRGDDVVALVRTPSKAGELEALGCTLVQGDLSDKDAIRKGVEGCDAVFHVAAVYKVGIPESEHAAMFDANVTGTERVFDAAADAGVDRIVYVSTIGVFGNTQREVVDESFVRTDKRWLSAYDETKYLAHEIAKQRIAAGAPIVIVQPGGVYGPGDQSEVANLIDQLRSGKLKMVPFGDTGFNLVYVDDVVDGILLAHDRGRVGESYVLGGEITTIREAIEKMAAYLGKKAPKRDLPVGLVKAVAPFGPIVGKMLGFPPNFRELISASNGVTYWASDAKARSELGYSPRSVDEGLAPTLV